jgi:hypothetical protein
MPSSVSTLDALTAANGPPLSPWQIEAPDALRPDGMVEA